MINVRTGTPNASLHCSDFFSPHSPCLLELALDLDKNYNTEITTKMYLHLAVVNMH